MEEHRRALIEGISRIIPLFVVVAEITASAAAPPIVINEWMVANQSTLADSADGDFDDWVELFNPNPFAVDLSGWHLTDNLANTTQWPLPAGSVILAGGYLLVWADTETAQLGFHANFQLEENEAIGLFAADSTQVDAVTFGVQASDVSQGRVPNGSGTIRYMTSPTPQSANVATSLVVTNVNNSGPGSLRQAIINANITPGLDTITFSIPGAGLHSIAPTSALPTIADPVILDGYTQPGASANTLSNGNNAILRIELSGANAGGSHGLFINTSNCLLRGFAINRWAGNGIQIYISSSGNIIQGNFIGTDPTGSLARTNGMSGVYIQDGSGNLIGGPAPAHRNVISANADNGVLMHGVGCVSNRVEGNYIGVNAAGTAALGNVFFGVRLNSSPRNSFGSTTPGAGNLISGNLYGAMLINAVDNTIEGNLVGTDLYGSVAISNGSGIALGSGNRLGGTNAASRNVISGNLGSAVQMGLGSTSNIIQGNFIGINAAGAAALSNQNHGIEIQNASYNLIGGAAAGAGNVISGNGLTAITINAFSPGNQVQGNLIGTDAFGTNAIPNATRSNHPAIQILGAARNLIGGNSSLERNIISGNLETGIAIQTSQATNNRVIGNFIGTDITGSLPLGNGLSGVLFEGAPQNTVDHNVISGNGTGIQLVGTNSSNNVIEQNLIGTDVTGLGALGNTAAGIALHDAPNNIISSNVVSGNQTGVVIEGGNGSDNVIRGNIIGLDASGLLALPNQEGINIVSSSRNLIGGVTGAARNLISGNSGYGVLLNLGANANQIFGNYIGTRADGSTPVGNGFAGVTADAAPGNFIGGSGVGQGNVISGNGIGGIPIGGVYLLQPASQNNIVAGNRIGTDPTGLIPVPNLGAGVLVSGAANNIIGGSTPTAGNVIAFNTQRGVLLFGDTAVGNAILRNSITANVSLGIDLGADGVTPNDPGDIDGSPNHLQNFPVLTAAWTGAATFVRGSLNSAAGKSYRLEFFANTDADPSGYGEGQTFLGSTNLATDGAGNAQFLAHFAAVVPPGRFLTATATDPDNNTSEFSATATVAATPPLATLILVNGQVAASGAAVVTNFATVELWSSLPNAVIYYTRDGSDPAATPLSYSGPFLVAASETIRAVAYTADFSQTVASDTLAITVQAAPVITMQPQHQAAAAGNTVVFSVQAQGTALLSFQWLTNGVPSQGATSSTLSLVNVATGQSGAYRAVVTNAFGAVTSAVAILSVLSPASITTGPASTNVSLGSNVTFCVTANGSPPLIYQWRKNGVNILNATNNCLTITNVQLSDGATYVVVVANDLGAVLSPPAQLVVEVPSPPPEDYFSNRVSLATANGTNTGSNVLSTQEPGEPDHAGKPCSNSVWYTWTAPANGVARFRTTGSTFDTLLAIYTGTNVASLAGVAADDDAGSFLASDITFNATNGTAYQIAVDGLGGTSGSFVLRWQFEATTNALPVITMQPCDAVVLYGASASLSVAAAPQPLAYQWSFNGQSIPDATNSSYFLASVLPENVGFYSVRISNGATQTVSRAALVEINSLLGDTSKEKIEDLLAPLPCGPARLRFMPTGNTASSVAVGSIGYAFVDGTSLNNLSECVKSSHCGGIANGARFLRLQMAGAGTCVLEAAGSSGRVGMWVCRGGLTDVDTALNHTFLRCVQSTTPDGRAILSFQAEAGRQYLIWLARLDAATGQVELRWKLGSPPVIAQLPVSRFVGNGEAVTFSVTASNRYGSSVAASDIFPVPTVEWLLDGQPLANGSATVQFTISGLSTITSSLTLASAALGNVGAYTAMVSNVISSTSVVARLSVIDASTVFRTNQADEPLYLGEVVSSDPACPTRYQWRFAGTNLPSQTNITLRLSQAGLPYAGNFSLVVTNCICARTSTVAVVTVKADLRIQPWLVGNDLAFHFITDRPANAALVEWLPAPAATNWRQLFTTSNLEQPISLPRTNQPSAVYRARLLP